MNQTKCLEPTCGNKHEWNCETARKQGSSTEAVRYALCKECNSNLFSLSDEKNDRTKPSILERKLISLNSNLIKICK